MKLAQPTMGVALSAVATGLVLVGAYFFYSELNLRLTRSEAVVVAVTPTLVMPEVSQEPQIFKLMFAGDVMLGRHVGDMMAEKNDWQWPFRLIANTLNGADVTFANLEGPMSARGIRSGSIYSFRFDPRAFAGLTYAGLDVLSLANNHMWDYGQVALTDTLDNLKATSISSVGAGRDYVQAYQPVVKTLADGTCVGFLAYTEFLKSGVARPDRPGIAWLDEERMIKDIQELREKCDIIVVSVHAGEEYQVVSHERQRRWYHMAIDAGADLVVGHHPHVVQGVEEYKPGKWIAYSLGNFIFDQNFSKETMEGLLIEATVQNKKITAIKKIPIGITPEHQAYLK